MTRLFALGLCLCLAYGCGNGGNAVDEPRWPGYGGWRPVPSEPADETETEEEAGEESVADEETVEEEDPVDDAEPEVVVDAGPGPAPTPEPEGVADDESVPEPTVETEAGSGAVLVSWDPPSENTDDSLLTDLAGFNVYWGPDAQDLPNQITIENAGVSSVWVEDLSPGTYYFATTAFNAEYVESDISASVAAVIE